MNRCLLQFSKSSSSATLSVSSPKEKKKELNVSDSSNFVFFDSSKSLAFENEISRAGRFDRVVGSSRMSRAWIVFVINDCTDEREVDGAQTTLGNTDPSSL